ncbi:hypothetical protein JCM10207_000325 [Rhodosporidiobolus poonsookiae]
MLPLPPSLRLPTSLTPTPFSHPLTRLSLVLALVACAVLALLQGEAASGAGKGWATLGRIERAPDGGKKVGGPANLTSSASSSLASLAPSSSAPQSATAAAGQGARMRLSPSLSPSPFPSPSSSSLAGTTEPTVLLPPGATDTRPTAPPGPTVTLELGGLAAGSGAGAGPPQKGEGQETVALPVEVDDGDEGGELDSSQSFEDAGGLGELVAQLDDGESGGEDLVGADAPGDPRPLPFLRLHPRSPHASHPRARRRRSSLRHRPTSPRPSRTKRHVDAWGSIDGALGPDAEFEAEQAPAQEGDGERREFFEVDGVEDARPMLYLSRLRLASLALVALEVYLFLCTVWGLAGASVPVLVAVGGGRVAALGWGIAAPLSLAHFHRLFHATIEAPSSACAESGALIAGFWGREIKLGVAYAVVQGAVLVGSVAVGARLGKVLRWESFKLTGADRRAALSHARSQLFRLAVVSSAFWIMGYQAIWLHTLSSYPWPSAISALHPAVLTKPYRALLIFVTAAVVPLLVGGWVAERRKSRWGMAAFVALVGGMEAHAGWLLTRALYLETLHAFPFLTFLSATAVVVLAFLLVTVVDWIGDAASSSSSTSSSDSRTPSLVVAAADEVVLHIDSRPSERAHSRRNSARGSLASSSSSNSGSSASSSSRSTTTSRSDAFSAPTSTSSTLPSSSFPSTPTSTPARLTLHERRLLPHSSAGSSPSPGPLAVRTDFTGLLPSYSERKGVVAVQVPTRDERGRAGARAVEKVEVLSLPLPHNGGAEGVEEAEEEGELPVAGRASFASDSSRSSLQPAPIAVPPPAPVPPASRWSATTAAPSSRATSTATVRPPLVVAAPPAVGSRWSDTTATATTATGSPSVAGDGRRASLSSVLSGSAGGEEQKQKRTSRSSGGRGGHRRSDRGAGGKRTRARGELQSVSEAGEDE